ncbi:hypothetical protein EIP86_001529 [Pleurotus ostreatoroseus]|nr:hypothetical protein EIP86_001529 [Pleurotus ostreatoroseus]
MHYRDAYTLFYGAEIDGQLLNIRSCSNTSRHQAPSIDQANVNLSDPFKRSAYASFNFDGITPAGKDSYMRTMPAANFNAAYSDFQASRTRTLASFPPSLSSAESLAALHGGSASSLDLITPHVLDAPPVTATVDENFFADPAADNRTSNAISNTNCVYDRHRHECRVLYFQPHAPWSSPPTLHLLPREPVGCTA